METIQGKKSLTYVYQPNRLTEAHYDYTFLQEKLLNYVMFYLQMHIANVMKGEQVQQLDIFKAVGDEIVVKVPMGLLVPPRQYPQLRSNADKLGGQMVRMKHKTPEGQALELYRAIFSGIGRPENKKRSQDLYLFIRKDVAHWLMHIDRNSNGEPFAYTSYYWEVTNSARNKYTSRIYKILSSWKKKGGTRAYTIQELKEILQLGDKYEFNDIKRRVLDPVRDELKEMYDAGDCDLFFEVKTMTSGRRVDQLSFKIITATGAQHTELIRKQVVKLLVEYFKFNDALLKQLDPIFHPGLDYQQLLQKIIYLYDRYRIERSAIPHPQAWVIKSLLNEFAK